MKITRYMIYWAVATLTLTFGVFILACQFVGQKELPSANSPSSYMGYVGGVWRGDEGMSIHDTTLANYTANVFCLVLPYLLMAIGLWLGKVAYRLRKSNINPGYISQAGIISSCSETNPENIWPPPIRK